ncbi:D-aminoacyl-tRNA deacylase [Sulfurovum sp. ST-21]|uniref:D-aminoacyl-tRNA deacylase n=1 Tax=Sulfurovum indicum TaxID=2779528 RepID=A0A7M1S1R1_9BACT|nr:D-aminoacyl-tRNA deacylase [Sulfurovum indicum]QOR61357.1 D-tyrosyl-tRNA(Tyr) deacylase [Sulfurovum indicum]
MIALIQRVEKSWVKVNGEQIAAIGRGYNILLGVMEGDTYEDVTKLVRKVLALRIFPNEEGKMDRNIVQVVGEVLVVSQFTLAGRIKKGNRPDFTGAMEPKGAKTLYELFIEVLSRELTVASGEFGAMMEVGIVNDGPVTIIADSKTL